jgi:aminopeptidase N
MEKGFGSGCIYSFAIALVTLLLSLSMIYAVEDIENEGKVIIHHYDIKVELDPDTHSFRAAALMELEVASSAGEIKFAFNKKLVIQSIKVNGREVKFNRRNNELVLIPGNVADLSAPYKVEVEYWGTTGDTMGEFQWTYIGEVSYIIYESLWYPTIQGVRAPSRLEIIVPKGYSAITSGELIGIEDRGESWIYVWEDVEPAYGISLAAGKYRTKAMKIIDVGKSPILKVYCYMFEKDFYLADHCLRTTKDILEFYSSRIGDYPYRRFSVVEMPEEFFGGHSDQGFILLQSNVLRSGSKEFIAHEIAHNWWGALVSAEGGYNLYPFFGLRVKSTRESSNNHWLNEGFATYSALMYLEERYGRDRMIRSLKEKRREYFQARKNDAAPISKIEADYGSQDYHAVVYSKGAFVLHMLRYVVGEERFDRIIETYLQRFGGRCADIESFKDVSEGIYGELDWFFDTWIDSNALPDYAVGRASTSRCPEGYCTNIEILQEGDVVKMPLDVAIHTSEGWKSKRIWMTGAKKSVDFVSSSKPSAVELDPNYWILEDEKANNIRVLEYLSIGGLKALVNSFLYRLR